jgi:hypothetical protein
VDANARRKVAKTLPNRGLVSCATSGPWPALSVTEEG